MLLIATQALNGTHHATRSRSLAAGLARDLPLRSQSQECTLRLIPELYMTHMLLPHIRFLALLSSLARWRKANNLLVVRGRQIHRRGRKLRFFVHIESLISYSIPSRAMYICCAYSEVYICPECLIHLLQMNIGNFVSPISCTSLAPIMNLWALEQISFKWF
jgi:hypothetical protein